jgi:hypothetical protein
MPAALNVRLHRWWNKDNHSPKAARAVPLGLEQLEDRALPSAALNQTFLATLYQGELKRNIEPTALTFWNNQLSQTGSRAQVAGAILHSNEFFNREVATDFTSLLGRNADAGGLQTFVQDLQNGATPQQIQALIMGSDEFFARVGGDPASFVNAVYGEVLNRPVDATGVAAWAPLAVGAASRTAIVQAVEASPEAAQLMVATIYGDTLGRAPDAAGLSYWASQLEQGQSQTAVLAGVVGSDEFFSRMQAAVAQINTNDPNVAAAGFIAADHLFTSQPRVVPFVPPVAGQAQNNDNSPNAPTGAGVDNSDVLGAGPGDNSGIDTSGVIAGSTSDGSAPVIGNSGSNTGCDNTSPDNSGDCSGDCSGDTPTIDDSGAGGTDCSSSDS